MFGLGAGEILIILAFALIFIGPKKLPELARGLGKSIREFQKAKDELLASVHEEADDLKQGITQDAPKKTVHQAQPVDQQEEAETFEEHHSALTQDQSESLAEDDAPDTPEKKA